MSERKPGFYERLVPELARLPAETDWVEFKVDNTDPEMIGKRISALSNSATLEDQEAAYLIWGVTDDTHEIVGTAFTPTTAKKGNENLEAWLVRGLTPRLNISFHSVAIDGKPVVVLEIPAARMQPTRFDGREWIRVGSTTHPLGDHGAKEAQLWRQFDRRPFENNIAQADCSEDQVVERLDYAAYFEQLKIPLDLSPDFPPVMGRVLGLI
ncbi:ATP-binding protein [Bosea sp. TND4EK4]|uniref:AlbA family DNA-binding domain-containing protein n=1 Tax=Bosea sp. TND4EK4 TaxID=1907408 RepID=UPI000953BC69|nr:ATP-binding protein [Bosea sp. TND4EK4]SIQ12139.1 Putative DNA-binding domain-containing protein [Bosea sp. TND4EK4]